jgi:hypothetical protein
MSRARFVSTGHAGGRYDADVFGSGSRFIEEHFEHGTNRPGPLFMMEKAGSDWRYTAVGPAGERVRDGVIPACEGCHAEAPDDHVFRVDAATAGRDR